MREKTRLSQQREEIEMRLGLIKRCIVILLVTGVMQTSCESKQAPKVVNKSKSGPTNQESSKAEELLKKERELTEREEQLRQKREDASKEEAEQKEAEQKEAESEEDENDYTREDFVEYCSDDALPDPDKRTLFLLNEAYGESDTTCSKIFEILRKETVIDLTLSGADPDSKKLSSLEPFKFFSEIKGLRLGHHDVRSLGPIKKLRNLQFLWLAYNKNLEIDPEDLPAGLKDLLIEGTGIESLSGGPADLVVTGLSGATVD